MTDTSPRSGRDDRRLSPPVGVLAIARRLEEAGHETWCVGGAVRDALLGHPQLDWDLATAATPTEVRSLFRRTIPIGIEFGTVGVVDDDGVMHEVTTFRRDVRTDGRRAEVEFGVSLDEDLARRDLTINAIAYSPARDLVHDPFDGRGDMARRVVRAVGDPATRMREDRLRALRAIRFAGRFDFAIEDGTWAAIVESAPFLGRLSPERVREEIEKTMRQVERPSVSLERWRASGALAVLVPSLTDVPALRFQTADCLPMAALARRPHRAALRLASLWMDAEPTTADGALRALRASNAQTRTTVLLAERWRALAPRMRWTLLAPGAPTDAEIRRWAAVAGRTRVPALMRLAAARFSAERAAGVDAPAAEQMRSVYRRAIRIAYRDPIELADLAVDGDDVARATGTSGASVGAILRALVDLVVEDPQRNVRATLLEAAQRLAAARGDPLDGGAASASGE